MIQDKTSQKINLDECNHIAQPLLDQLVGVDWGIIDHLRNQGGH